MTDIVDRLRKAAKDFEAIRDHEGNMEDSDSEPHWSNYTEMDDASDASNEAADEILRLRSLISDRPDARAMALEEAAMGWQPMSTAPKDRRILIDASYVYPDDKSHTEVYVICKWRDHAEYPWLFDDGSMRHDAPIGWIEIPPTSFSSAIRALAKGGGE